ncbi:MAG: hypothetical protein Q8P67_21130, partial [archaeon]|nr:hypothetical protein [archaeon]
DSPQGGPPTITPFTIYPPTANDRAQWISDLRSQIQQCVIQRQHSMSSIQSLTLTQTNARH